MLTLLDLTDEILIDIFSYTIETVRQDPPIPPRKANLCAIASVSKRLYNAVLSLIWKDIWVTLYPSGIDLGV